MRFVLAVLIALIPAVAPAASLEETYYASRAAYIKKFQKPAAFDDARSKEHDLALADLLKQLRRIVGPLNLKDVAASDTETKNACGGDARPRMGRQTPRKRGSSRPRRAVMRRRSTAW